MSVAQSFYIIIAALSLLNFFRIFAMLIASDVYDIKAIRTKRLKRRHYKPLVSVIIPAYNEETGVLRTVESVLANTYKNKEVIVVNDGSKDKTKAVLRSFQRKNPGAIKVIHQANAGKAAALNRGIQKWARGSLVMVLDADSVLHPDGLAKMVEHFRDKRVLASASNVKIISTKKVYGIAQRFEYLISYRMKRALSVLNMEYIVGGVGSTFRKSALLKVGGYDTDTITEDIDLTVKLIREYGNKFYRINYAADCLTYTEHVLTFRSLVRQRLRWKYGRFQTLIKNHGMIFNRSGKYNKRLTWYVLPYALFGEFILFCEPILIGYIVYTTLSFGDWSSILSVYLIVTIFILLLLLGEETEKFIAKVGLSLSLPFAYFLMYILSAVEFAALCLSIKKVKQLIKKEQHSASWEHVERTSESVVL